MGNWINILQNITVYKSVNGGDVKSIIYMEG